MMNVFQLPMPEPIVLDEHVNTDMSLHDLYNDVIAPKTCFGKQMIDRWTKMCTADVNFLKDTQRLLQTDLPRIEHNCDEIDTIRKKLGKEVNQAHDTEEGFHAKYQYMDWEPLMFMNRNRNALQCMSLYNLASPILSLCVPIIILVIPFLLIRMRGVTITVSSYIEVLQTVLKQHQIGQMFSFSSVSWDKRFYIIVSTCFYVLGIYQNIRSCSRFYANMTTIHSELQTVRVHVEASINYIQKFKECILSSESDTYESFSSTIGTIREKLLEYREKLNEISPAVWSKEKLFEIGHVMECFYELYYDDDVQVLLDYTCDFCGYIDNMYSVKESISKKKLGLCNFDSKKDKFYGAYLPGNSVPNSYSLSKHSLITGPNAAGKTTLLKATLFNVIISQQFGCGCYKRATLRPYHHIHCYLNIPDTNGRDSLFQAEAKRCKSILDSVTNHESEARHFCIFDELYSGTNPYEAVGSAVAFLNYLNKYPNVCLMLTTHFIDLCEMLDKQPGFRNRHMSVNILDDEFKYLYTLVDGISTIKGGVKVLKKLNYPDTIISSAYELINKDGNKSMGQRNVKQ